MAHLSAIANSCQPLNRKLFFSELYFLVAVLSATLSSVPLAYGDFAIATFANPGAGGSLAAGKVAWADYNDDGFLDVNLGSNLLRGDGPVSGQYILTNVNGSSDDALWGDYDKDGDLDLFAGSSGQLWENTGAGFANNVTVSGVPLKTRGMAWVDINGDTYLDVYIGGFESANSSVYYEDAIFINDTVGGFTKDQSYFPGSTPGTNPGRGITSADWDQDGDMDIYVSNYRLQSNQLWRNDGSGNLTNVSGTHNATGASGHSIGSAFGDFDNDGLIDLFAGNFAHGGQPESRFLMNQGSGLDYQFLDSNPADTNPAAGNQASITYVESYGSPTFGDIDNDGDLDLYFTAVDPGDTGKLWKNQFVETGDLTFTDITSTWDLQSEIAAFSTYQAAFGDYNDDGFLDLITAKRLFENDGTDNGASLAGNHYLKIKLDGDAGGFDATAIGAQVRIDLGGGQIVTRQVEGAVGEGNQNDHTLHFGLGTTSGPLQLEIMWPGGFTEFVNVSGVDQTVTIAPGFGADTWSNNAGGDWNDTGNWFGGVVPSGNTEGASFSGSNSAPSTVFTDSTVTVKSVLFNSGNTYAISGTGSVILDADTGNASMNVQQGTHKFQVDVLLQDDTDVSVQSGAKLEFNNDLHLNGNTLTKTGSGEIALNNAVISGGGSFVCGGGICSGTTLLAGSMASVGAVVSPGSGIGAMQVNGDFSPDAESTLLVEIGGTRAIHEHDLLAVGGVLAADGTLEVILAGDFAPTAGDQFDVLAFSTIVGEFSLDLPVLSGSLAWDVSQLYTSGALGITAIPEPGTLATTLFGLFTLSICKKRKGTRRD